MDRRNFVRVAGGGIAAGQLAEAVAAAQVAAKPAGQAGNSNAKARKALMKVGTQHGQGDANSYQGFAFAFGYIKALIAAVAAEL
jgi:hypothetical protein